MKKTIEKVYCDICGKEIIPNAEMTEDERTKFFEAHNIKMPVRRYFDGTDGRTHYNPPVYDYDIIDICENCLKKAVRLKDVGVQCVKVEFDD